jgi:hypothetical protein
MKHLCRALCLWLGGCCAPEPALKRYRVAPRDVLPNKRRKLLRRLARKLRN